MPDITPSKFKEFCNKTDEPKSKLSRQKIISFFARHKHVLEIASRASIIASSVIRNKDVGEIARDSISLAKYVFVESNDISSFFSEVDGWESCSTKSHFCPKAFIVPIIKSYPTITLSSSSWYRIFSITIPELGEVGIAEYGEHWLQIHYKKSQYSIDDLYSVLMKRLMSGLTSEFMKYSGKGEGAGAPSLESMHFANHSSEVIEKWVTSIERCKQLGIVRSIMFSGQPGSGKTTLCQSVLNRLGYRTLVFDFKDFERNMILFLVKYLKVEAILINDLDQVADSHGILDFLEEIRSHVKLVVASSNSMKEFHPAVIRAGRFDEIEAVNTMDEATVKQILGPALFERFGSMTKNFPAAFLHELVNRSMIYGDDKLDDHLLELDERVKKQIDILKTK
jgi:ATPase family associated with various cellular activities (AAA)